jgi:hypothetical protein
MKTVLPGFSARVLFALVGALAITSCGGGGGSSGATTNAPALTPASTQASVSELTDAFAATLNGAQVVPARPSGAVGAGTVVIDPVTRQMTATLTTTAIAGRDAAIHQAPAGLNGPIVFPLTETSPGSGVWATRTVVSEAQINGFRAADFYFNVRGTDPGTSEIRGQILSQRPSTTPVTPTNTGAATGTGTTSAGVGLNPFVKSTATFVSALRGSQEMPPTASNATGSGTVLLNPANRLLTAALTTAGIPGTTARIHEAAPGANGPIIIPLTESGTGSGVWTATVVISDAQATSLQAGNLYFNVNSTTFPQGEIRGQILPQTISLEFVTGAAGNTGATGTVITATPPTTGTTGTASTGNGTFGTGLTGTGTTGSSLTGTGTTGTGLTGTGTTGTSLTGTGMTGTGTTGTSTTGTGTTPGTSTTAGLVF